MKFSPRSLSAVCLCTFFPRLLGAAISVSGVSHETNYTGSASFTIDDPAGFTTNATLNGTAVAVGTSVDINGAGFYELVVTETPDGGGSDVTETLLFVIREPGRGSTETGLPSFRAVPLVNDAPSAVNTGTLRLVAPSSFPEGLDVPVVALLEKANGDPLWLNAEVRSSAFPGNTIQLRRGFGYSILPGTAGAGVMNYNGKVAGLTEDAQVTIEADVPWTAVSGTISSSTDWEAGARIDVTGDLTISPAATLTIGEGAVIRVAPGADIFVDGELDINGAVANPVVFTSESLSTPWGGIFLNATTSVVDARGTIFLASGANQNWFAENSGYSKHRDEQALFLVGPEEASLTLNDCYMIENRGQVLHNDDGGDISITRCLIQGAPTVGQLNGGTFTADRSALLLFPTDDPSFADGDNDALYLTSGIHTLTNTVVGYTQDDGLDTGGSPSASTNTVSTLQFCWLESILHEGMSNSGAKTCRALDSVFFNCGQTIESGYDGPQSFLERTLCVANMVGARMGDNYDWDYTGNQLTVTDCFLLNNLYHDIWGYDWSSWTYNDAKMTVTGTVMTRPGDLSRHPEGGNRLWDPATNGNLIAGYMPVPGSNVGIAITGAPLQQSISDYSPALQVQLSTFSSNTVSIDYSVLGKMGAAEQVIANGSLVFLPGETLKTASLPIPGGQSFDLVRVSLSNPFNAEVTGGEAWYFQDEGNPPDGILISRGATWSYSAEGSEPAGAWAFLGFDDASWNSGAAQIGFGDGDEVTVLTPGEAGPDNDRTRTVYFRKVFQVLDPAAISELRVDLLRDDGAVVYLNGTEVTRSNMDPGVVAYETFAAGSAGSSSVENSFNLITLNNSALDFLQAGVNVIAVEVHQSSTGSSDLSFDLELQASFENLMEAVLELVHFQGQPYLFWRENGLVLEESGDLDNWMLNPFGYSPFPVLVDEAPRKFFRLAE